MSPSSRGNDYSEQAIYLMLRIIEKDSGVEALINIGYDYSQIAKLLVLVAESGLAHEIDGKYSLTQVGMLRINDYLKKNTGDPSKAWILPLENAKIARLDKFDIFVPDMEKTNLS